MPEPSEAMRRAAVTAVHGRFDTAYACRCGFCSRHAEGMADAAGLIAVWMRAWTKDRSEYYDPRDLGTALLGEAAEGIDLEEWMPDPKEQS